MTLPELTIFIATLLGAIIGLGLIARLIAHITRGQTKELKTLAAAMALLVPAWLLEAINALPSVHSGFLAIIFEPFGLAWYVEHFLILAGVALLVIWSWHYITLRLLPQFYLAVVAIGLTSFVLSTVIFTTVLFNTAEQQALKSIEADVRTYALVLSELTDRTIFTSAAIGARGGLISAAQDNNSDQAKDELGDPITDYKVSAAYVLNAGGEIITTIGAESIIGQSFAQDPVAIRVLKGELAGSPILQPGPEAPAIIIRAGTPLVNDGQVVGAILVDTPLDTAFVDRVGNVTGLSVTVYAEQALVATTLRDDNGRPLVAATIEDPEIINTTLHQGNVFAGTSTLASKPYFVAAIPLTNIDGVRIGALAAGLPEQELLDALKAGTQTSFLVAFGLLLLSLAPFFFLAKFLAKSASEAR